MGSNQFPSDMGDLSKLLFVSKGGDESQVLLPLPGGFTETLGLEWEMKAPSVANLVGDIEAAAASGDLDGAAAGLASQVIDRHKAKADDFVQAFMATQDRFAANPNVTAFFKQAEPRKFTFVWVMIPRSAAETSSIRNITQAFRKGALPRVTGSGRLLNYPSVWDIAIIGPGTGFYTKIYQSVVNSVAVQLNSGGATHYEFPDGAPHNVTLTLEMTELKNLTREDI